jgi:DNA-binding NtrC family response regulator
VLLLGASGTGKELAARALHRLSAAGARKLVARNAATIPDGIADAELFGNARNYPNPGMPQRHGLVGEADGSTLFLDEFAELSAAVQARLLRVLDEGEYQPLGEPSARRSTFRLVAATNRPESVLKPDLAARLRFRIELPDLGARREDIPLLVRHLLARASSQAGTSIRDDEDSTLSCELIAESLQRSYATNVRELESWLAEKISVAPGEGPILGRAAGAQRSPSASTLPPEAVPRREPSSPGADPEGAELGAAEIQAMLDRHNGVIETTWRALGLKNRHALARLIAKHGLEIRKRAGRPGPRQ